MSTEEKQLLLKDLCSRLPYGVYVRINETHCLDKNEAMTEGFIGGYCKPNMCQDYSLDEIDEFLDEDDDVKLYLRSMSSMTKEEKQEYYDLTHQENDDIWAKCLFDKMADFCNERHLDYRGLIEKGLALEAPEGMYKTE